MYICREICYNNHVSNLYHIMNKHEAIATTKDGKSIVIAVMKKYEAITTTKDGKAVVVATTLAKNLFDAGMTMRNLLRAIGCEDATIREAH